MKKKEKIILSFDLEFWYNGEFLKKYLPKNKDSLKGFIEEPIKLILDLLKIGRAHV